MLRIPTFKFRKILGIKVNQLGMYQIKHISQGFASKH